MEISAGSVIGTKCQLAAFRRMEIINDRGVALNERYRFGNRKLTLSNFTEVLVELHDFALQIEKDEPLCRQMVGMTLWWRIRSRCYLSYRRNQAT